MSLIEGSPIDKNVFVTPLKIKFKPQAFPDTNESTDAEALSKETTDSTTKDSVLAVYHPAIEEEERAHIEKQILSALDISFPKNIKALKVTAKKGAAKKPDRAALFEEAEDLGAHLVLEVTLTDNRIVYKGTNTGKQILDLILMVTFPPFNIWVHDEVFELTRTYELRFHDVREPDDPLRTSKIIAKTRQDLNEFQHGYILLNGFRGFMEDPTRYEGENWRHLYEQLIPHCDHDLQKKVAEEADNAYRTLLQSPTIKKRLEEGTKDQERLYAVLIGANLGHSKAAQNDVKELRRLMRDKASIKSSRILSFTGSKLTRADILGALQQKLKTKRVDRVLFYFSGQGRNKGKQQELMLSDTESLSLKDIHQFFKSSVKAGNIAFLLDTSFAKAERGKGLGGRTHKASKAPPNPTGFLSLLGDEVEGWQVICAAGYNENAGEYQGHGILSGLLIKQIENESSEIGLGALVAKIEEFYLKRSKSILGGRHSIFMYPEARREFSLLRLQNSRSTKKAPK